MNPTSRIRLGLLAAVALLAASAAPTAAQAADYSAQVTRNNFGVAQIRANDYGSLAYGAALANAKDDICGTASLALTVRGELSRFFGPEDGNLESDLYHARLNAQGSLAATLAAPPPRGPSSTAREVVAGFVAGYNAHLRRFGNDDDPRCANEPWVRPLSVTDGWRIVAFASQLPDGDLFAQLAAAEPPASGATTAALPPAPTAEEPPDADDLNSNAIALGGQTSSGGQGLLAYDPHQNVSSPIGTSFQRLTIPGTLDVFGHRAIPIPGVITSGSTDGVAFGVTADPGTEFALFELELKPGSPTKYVVDGQTRTMRATPVSVTVLGANGQLRTENRTLYDTDFGPVASFEGGEWTTETAYAIQDVSLGAGVNFLDYHLQLDRAESVGEVRQAIARWGGTADGHTLASDRTGRALFQAPPAIVNVPESQLDSCLTPLGEELLSVSIPVLDGSRTSCDLRNDPDAYLRGSVGLAATPTLQTNSYALNTNDTHWLVNPAVRLTGFSRFFGDGDVQENRPLSLRARLAFKIVQDRLSGTDGQAGNRFDLARLQGSYFNQRNLSAELERTRVVARCEQAGSVVLNDGTTVDLRPACATLATWDGRANTTSRGAVLWRVFWGRLPGVSFSGDLPFFTTPFSTNDPLNTPRTLDLTGQTALKALGQAVRRLRADGLALNVSIGEAQRFRRGGSTFPLPGCSFYEGCVFVADPFPTEPSDAPSYTTEDPFGTQAPLFASLDAAKARVRYVAAGSQAANPASPHHADMTARFSNENPLLVDLSNDVGVGEVTASTESVTEAITP